MLILGESGTGQGTGRPGDLSPQPPQPGALSWPSTARPFPSRCWKASCSATSGAPSPGPTAAASASSSSATAARIFLDEIGDMAPAPRPRSCGCSRRGVSSALGGSETISVDVRIIAATNQDLDDADRAGPLPQGPLLPAQRRDDPSAAAARAPRGHRRTGPLLPLPLQPATGHVRAVHLARGLGVAGEVRLAGKRARIAERDSRSR